MKHDLSSNTTFKNSHDLTKEIVKVTHSEFNTDDIQLNAMIHPLVSNAEYRIVNKELENERFKTLVSLARVLDDENLSKAINGLNYSLSISVK